MLDFLEGLAQARTIDAVWSIFCLKMADFGFDRLIYGYSRFSEGGSFWDLDDAVFLTNHNPEYFQKFIRERMFLFAPVTRWARNNEGSCSWGTLWSDTDNLSEKEREIIAFNRSMNVTAGYTIRFPAPNPSSFALVAMAARPGLTQANIDRIWAENGRQIEALSHMAHLKIVSLPHKTARTRLSNRQREVLEWVGKGKSNKDIATILGVAVPTVEKHLRLARERLGVETTAQAVLKASFQHQIFSG